MDIFQFDALYRSRINASGKTGETVYLKSDTLEVGLIRVINHVLIVNKTSSYTLCRLSVFDGAVDFFVDEAIQPSAKEFLKHTTFIILGARDFIRAALTGTTDDDILEMILSGWQFQRK